MEQLENARKIDLLSTLADKPADPVLMEEFGGMAKLAQETDLLKEAQPHPHPVRTLKIEADGDVWKGLIKPKIRLMGRWLERAGFKPGDRVNVACVAPGVIELRSPALPDAMTMRATAESSSEQSQDPF